MTCVTSTSTQQSYSTPNNTQNEQESHSGYFDNAEIDYRLGEIIYESIKHQPDFSLAADLLAAFKEEFTRQGNNPNISQEIANSVPFLVNLVSKLHELNSQIETEADEAKKQLLQIMYSDKETTLCQKLPYVAQDLLNMDHYFDYMKGIEGEAHRLFPNDYEARANYLERF